MRKTFVATAIIVFISAFARANDCSSIKSSSDVIECAIKKSPDIQSAELELKRSQEQITAAGQWQNPELSVQSVSGTIDSDKRQETDISLGIPIQLGGKIAAREIAARSESLLAEALLFEAKAKIKTEVSLKLHRLRQLLHEQEIIDESIGAFSKLVTQYSKRPGLSPEQQMTLSVYQLSKGDYELQKSESMDELLQLNAYFKMQVGLSVDQLKKHLPASLKSWPLVKVIDSKKLSPAQQRLMAELESSKASLAAAQSEAWPTLTVGPTVKLQKESNQSNSLVGFNASLPLPLFNLNGGAKAAAKAQVNLSETKKNIGLLEQQLKQDELLSTYNQAVEFLKTSLSHEDIERKHKETDRLFNKGVIPSALVIEAHRTSLDLEKTRHARELKALESLLNIYTLDGSIMEMHL